MPSDPPSRTLTLDQERMLARMDALQRELSVISVELDRMRELAAMGELAGMIAHEVRNIMTPVAGECQRALRPGAGMDAGIRAASAGLEAVERVRAVTDAVLDLANAAGQGRLAERADLSRSMQRVVGWFEDRYASRGIEIDLELGSVARTPVVIAPVAFEQVLSNLFENALQAMPEGGALTVRATIEPREGSTGNTARIRVVLQDSGPGLDPQTRAWLREVLEAPEDTPTVPAPEATGSGLGLRLCARLLHQAGGSLDILEQTEPGAAFVISLDTEHDALSASIAA